MNYIRINIGKLLGLALISCFVLSTKNSASQCAGICGPNLVNNSSFELTTADCGTMNPEIFTDYSQVQDWFGTACLTCPGNGSTPDYYNSACTGATATENCGLGSGSVGFFTSVDVGGTAGSNAREYVQTQLTTPLVPGQEYCATIQVKTSPASFSYVPTDGLGLWFTNAMVDIDVDNGGQQYLGPGSIVNATPQIANTAGNIIDTVCTTITGTFVATGTESWMVMGNFRPDNAIQTTATTCGGFFSFCFGYLIVDQVDVFPVCSSCDATIAAAGPFCLSDPSVNLTATDPGGTWSGPGITDAINGTFDPSVAGTGVHNIIYDLTCGDDDTISITVTANDDSSISYPNTSYCLTDIDPTPTITGLAGGNFSINNGGIIDNNTGVIDLSASGNGSFTISYLTNGQCPTTGTFDVDIFSNSDATISSAGPFCIDDPVSNLSAADAGGTWSGIGISNSTAGTFDPFAAGIGNHTIYYEISGTCGDLDSISIIVNDLDDASFSYSQSSYCLSGSNPTPIITGATGGTFTINGSGSINATSGEIDLTASGLGNYIITYLTSGSCPNSSTFNVSISNSLDATITPAGPFCQNDPSMNLSAANLGGVWNGNGVTDINQGTFDPSIAGVGSHQIIYTISGACGDADTIEIIVSPADNANISYSSLNYCSTDTNPVPNITGTVGGVFSMNNGGNINPSTGEIDLITSGSGSFIISYITSGTCPDTATYSINVSNGTPVSINYAGPICYGTTDLILTVSPAGGIWSGIGISDSINGIFNSNLSGIGTHTVSYNITGSCPSSANINIEVYDQPSISLTGPHTLNFGQSLILNPTYSGGGTFSWSPSENLDCADCSNPTITPITTTSVCVELSNGICSDTACTDIIVDYNCGEVVVPTAFSPNSGDINSLECVIGNCVSSMIFKIYDRWGELVFETNDPSTCWDGTHVRNGKEMSTGVYVFHLEANLVDGTEITQKGNITLLR